MTNGKTPGLSYFFFSYRISRTLCCSCAFGKRSHCCWPDTKQVSVKSSMKLFILLSCLADDKNPNDITQCHFTVQNH